jgi:hypothetical protein
MKTINFFGSKAFVKSTQSLAKQGVCELIIRVPLTDKAYVTELEEYPDFHLTATAQIETSQVTENQTALPQQQSDLRKTNEDGTFVNEVS